MKSMLRGVLAAGVFVLCAAAGLTAAKADVIRIALVVSDNKADYDSNAAMAATFDALLKKAAGVKTAYVGVDAVDMTIMSASVWRDQSHEMISDESGSICSPSRTTGILPTGARSASRAAPDSVRVSTKVKGTPAAWATMRTLRT